MCMENGISLADQLREERFTTKQDLLEWLDKEMLRVSDQSKSDKKHSAAFYYAYSKLLNRFHKKIENTVLFNRLEDFWYYSMSVSSSGAVLSLEYAPKCELNKKGTVTVIGGQSLPIIHVPGRFLTVEEYAAEYDVGAGTVRQWIRRGKIRTAKKTGKEWIIPEMTELPQRGYQSATYFYNGQLSNRPDEFSYLDGKTVVIINQSHEEPGKFEVLITAGGKVTPVMKTLDTKDREKLELFLISHPDVHYVEGPSDGMNVSISSKDTGEEWVP